MYKLTMRKFMGVDVGKIKGLDGITVLDSDYLSYVARVASDGGTIINSSYVLDSITHAKQNGYWDYIASWVSASFGVKKDGSNAISKLYSLRGTDPDQTAGANQPTWIANTQNGKAVISFNGSSHYLNYGGSFNISDNLSYITSFSNKGTNKTAYIFSRCPNEDTWGTFSYLFTGGNLYLSLHVTATIENPIVSSYASIPTSTILSFIYNWPNASVFSNGPQIGTTKTFSYHFTGNPTPNTSLGRNGMLNNYYFNGKICDFIALSTNASTSVRQAIESYQNAYYAIY